MSLLFPVSCQITLLQIMYRPGLVYLCYALYIGDRFPRKVFLFTEIFDTCSSIINCFLSRSIPINRLIFVSYFLLLNLILVIISLD